MRVSCLLLLCFSFFVQILVGQTDFEEYRRERKTAFMKFRQQKIDEFQAFRAQRNAEFAAYIGKAWTSMPLDKRRPRPKLPDPVDPVVAEPDQSPSKGDNLPTGTVSTPKKPDLSPIEFPVEPPTGKGDYTFTYYHTPCRIAYSKEMGFSLPDLKESTVANVWTLLSTERYDPLIADCNRLKREMNLDDWAFVMLLDAFTQSVYKGSANEAVMLKAYIMAQLGYDVRLCRLNERKLALLMPANENIYERLALKLEGKSYYLWGDDNEYAHIYTYKENLKEAKRTLSLSVSVLPKITYKASPPRLLRAKRYPDVAVSVTVNENLIDFYESFPITDWVVYANTPMETHLQQQLLPVLGKAILGKSERDAANLLIDFVQTAFDYQTDDRQFGREKTFFPDELCYYPYSDCEDRSVLYAYLVRQLMGLEVVLLHYPGHIATAVCFNEAVEGDYVMVKNKKYTVCDPTYIGSAIGHAMPQFKNVKAEIILL